ncbi:malectin domain-containing carbohydrate-binding protein [Geotalea sp. SG265]|uniref:malectin domain-containing carbohydrate-binding protein n=1 Tax=Geotalea sp. SG265 TaxID=2922867 RepID=UPI001FAF7775|nr:malectin domain-containing carbohydrate-binding protein [Geotalea sp. SG265]
MKPKTSPAAVLRVLLVVITVFLVATHLLAAPSHAAQASLTWSAPTTYLDGSPATPSGYKVYTGTVSGSYTKTTDVGNVTSYTESGLDDGTTYYFAIMAYDASGDMSDLSNQMSFTTPSPPVTPTYTLTASAGTGGTISPSGSIAISQGLSQTFTITPATGYKIAGVNVDGASVGAVSSYAFSNITANHTISASFTNVSYTISATAGTGGTISPAGTTTVTYGSSKTYTIAPSSGYKVADVKVDGVSVGAVTSYNFSNITANHTVAASFSAVAGKLVFATNSGGPDFTSSNGTLYKADTYYSGGSISKTTTAIAGTTDDTLYQTRRIGSCSYKIPVPNGNYSVTLKFAETYYSAAGQRYFNVNMEGIKVLNQLDVYALVGKNTAYDVTIPVSVSDGVLNIDFISVKGSAMIEALNVVTR